MAATFNVAWDFGGTANTPGTVEASLTNLRFNNEDTNDQDTASPITIPTAGTAYSFWKQIYLHCTGAPSVQVDNVQVYTDGTLGWTGCTVVSADDTLTHNSGSDAGYDPGQAAVLTTHDTVTAVTDFFTYNSGSTQAIAISESGSVIDAVDEYTNYLALSLQVTSSATQGTQATETITWQYDEI